MNTKEFKSLRVGDCIVESQYDSSGKYRKQKKYEVSTRYNENTIGIIPVGGKKEEGKILNSGPDLIFYQLLPE